MFQDKKILILGASPYGLHKAKYLAKKQVDSIHLADYQSIHADELHTSTLALTDFGTSRIVQLKQELERFAPKTKIELLTGLLNEGNDHESLRMHLEFNPPQYDMILDCTADRAIRQLLERLAELQQVAACYLVGQQAST